MEDKMRSITVLFLLAIIAVPAAVYQIGELTSFELHSAVTSKPVEVIDNGLNGDSNETNVYYDIEKTDGGKIRPESELKLEKQVLQDEMNFFNSKTVGFVDSQSGALTPLQRINTMPLEAWMEIKGIGPVTAERILSFRKEKDGFATMEDLLEVKGIGPAKHAAILEWLELQNK